MKNKFHQLRSIITYWLDVVDKHSLHSPFLFDFYLHVLSVGAPDTTLAYIEERRRNLLFDDRSIEVTDFGSGSFSGKGSTRKISAIAKTSLSPKKLSLLYVRIIQRYNCRNILELGTSLGINTLYLASASESSVSTFEGSVSIADEAQIGFAAVGAKNIKVITGNIDITLPRYLEVTEDIDFVYVDANHRYSPTQNYFNILIPKTHDQSVIVIDDIHYSVEMEKAWKEIQKHPKVRVTIDLYRCGIVLLNPALSEQHVVLRF